MKYHVFVEGHYIVEAESEADALSYVEDGYIMDGEYDIMAWKTDDDKEPGRIL